MKITLKDLQNKGIYKDWKEWFIENFRWDIQIDIEDLKIKLIEQKEDRFLKWLYINYKLSGEYIGYWDNGSVFIKCFYKKGKLDGEYIKYDENEEIIEKSYYKKGEKIKW
ncbi:hypothetical protein EOM09_01920 [bacterium]|nr:hypothetical protein [bacterium]